MEERVLVLPPGVPHPGLVWKSLPPSPVNCSKVKDGTWASNAGIMENDELVSIDGTPVKQLAGDAFTSKLGDRPLKLKFRRPPGLRTLTVLQNSGKLGLRFSQWPPSPVEVAQVLPSSWGEFSAIKKGDELVDVNGVLVTSFVGQDDFAKALQQRPLKLLIRFGPPNADGAVDFPQSHLATSAASSRSLWNLGAPIPPPTVPPLGANPLVLQPDSNSPRGLAHASTLNALAAHDGYALAEAISMARVVGISGDGLAAAERALEAMGGPHAVGSAERRRQAVLKLQAVIGSEDLLEIKAAVEECVEAGVEDPKVIEAGEKALEEMRSVKVSVMEDLVLALEDCVVSAEVNPSSGCSHEAMATLARRIDCARKISGGRQDDALIGMAERLLAFESQRATALVDLQDKIRQRAAAMERVVSEVQKRLPVDAVIPGTGGVQAAEQVLAAPGPGTVSRASGDGQFRRVSRASGAAASSGHLSGAARSPSAGLATRAVSNPQRATPNQPAAKQPSSARARTPAQPGRLQAPAKAGAAGAAAGGKAPTGVGVAVGGARPKTPR